MRIERVSTRADGSEVLRAAGPAVGRFSPDGSKITLSLSLRDADPSRPDSEWWWQSYIKDLETNELTLVSASDEGVPSRFGFTHTGFFSNDGKSVIFYSSGWDLFTDDTDAVYDYYIKDTLTGKIERLVTGINEEQLNGDIGHLVLSPDQKKIFFSSYANNIVSEELPQGSSRFTYNLYLYDRQKDEMILLPIYDEWPHAEWRHSPIGFSPDGSKVAFYAGTWPQETQRYVVVYNIETDEVTRNTVGFDFPSIEPREGDSHYTFPYIRVGEKYLISNVFSDLFSDENIPNNRTHAILDETTGEIDIFPRLTDGTTPNNTISSITVSPNGRLVAFSSYASNLVPGDTNGWPDVFVQDMDTGKIVRVSVAEDGREANLSSNNPVFSPDGTRLMFSSYASNLVPNDRNGTLDIFIVTLSELVSPIGLGRTEAETLKLPTGFFVEASVLASGGEWIRSGVNVENVASGAFDGPAGLYAITVGYMDETDGESAMAIRVNGVEVDAWVWDGDYGDAIATAAGRSRHAVFGVELAPGDAITFVGRGDGGEPLRTDWIEIAPTPLVGPGRTEAEDLAQVGFFVGTNPHASGGSWLQAEGDREARAAFVFDGEAGLHDLSIGYFDESDGASMMKIAVNGEIVHAWAWDADGGAAIAEPSSRAEHVAAGLDLAPGDLVELIGQADGGEPLRTDWIEIAPLAVWADPVDALMG